MLLSRIIAALFLNMVIFLWNNYLSNHPQVTSHSFIHPLNHRGDVSQLGLKCVDDSICILDVFDWFLVTSLLALEVSFIFIR